MRLESRKHLPSVNCSIWRLAIKAGTETSVKWEERSFVDSTQEQTIREDIFASISKHSAHGMWYEPWGFI